MDLPVTWGVWLLAMVAVVIGWRGRRIGDHPLCRKCGYDLYTPAGTLPQCPECGSTQPPRIGPRCRFIRHWIMVAAGIWAFVLSSILLVGWASRADVYTWMPSWVFYLYVPQPRKFTLEARPVVEQGRGIPWRYHTSNNLLSLGRNRSSQYELQYLFTSVELGGIVRTWSNSTPGRIQLKHSGGTSSGLFDIWPADAPGTVIGVGSHNMKVTMEISVWDSHRMRMLGRPRKIALRDRVRVIPKGQSDLPLVVDGSVAKELESRLRVELDCRQQSTQILIGVSSTGVLPAPLVHDVVVTMRDGRVVDLGTIRVPQGIWLDNFRYGLHSDKRLPHRRDETPEVQVKLVPNHEAARGRSFVDQLLDHELVPAKVEFIPWRPVNRPPSNTTAPATVGGTK